MGEVAENLNRVRETIKTAAEKCGRDPGRVRLIAVSKTKTAAMIQEAMGAGQQDFGENYAQELRDKMEALADPGLRWHYIGHLQKNKAKYVAGKVYEVHSVDSLDLARELDKRAEKSGGRQRVMLELNLAGEATKTGADPALALSLVRGLGELKALELVGLMTMPPYFSDPEEARPFYRGLRELRDRLRIALGDPGALPELSMGMSHDFAVAIEEGATRVRVGTAIFGEREKA